MKDLTEKTIRGGFAKVCAQAANFGLRIGALMVLGRLLDPKDFGLVGMVTAVIGVLHLFKDFGLSTATIQRKTISTEQLSTLFWINMLVGGVLGLLSLILAPAIAAFYHEPRLVLVTSVLAAGFLFNAAGVQHSALLQRQMRFTTAAVIDTIALVISIAIAIGMAFAGYRYWAIVAMTITQPFVSTIGCWIATAWIPGPPARRSELRSMMRFGGTITVNGLIVYIAYNLEKVLLGRYWGATAIGIYGRAYQLINIPTENLVGATGGVAFSALSRLQDDPVRLKSYFLKGYSLVLALTIPITLACALFAGDLIRVVLGPKWHDAVPIFQLLAPTILIFAMINPLAWLLFALGMVARSLKVALVLAPLVIVGYIIGLPHGPTGVALAYSAVMTVWAIPHIAWCVHGTVISLRDILTTVSRPLVSGLVSAGLAFAAQLSYGDLLSPLPRLLLGGSLLLAVYLGMLLYVMKQKSFYLDLFARLLKRPPAEEQVLISA
ncbi:MAG: Lipopolysaccharide biosynthesis protein WzxC [Bryobacteraceae bacterium]|nr:Lipopolysaccharide biosynthesis protein WzxC [Bryobacteraceae bacterium]